MTTQELAAKPTQSTEAGTHSIAEELGIDPRYEIISDVHALGGLQNVIDPFVDMQYPLNRDNDLPEGVIDNSNRWRAVHHPDGSGVVKSGRGSTIYGIRTADGTIVGNVTEGMWFPYRSDYHKRREDNSGEVEFYDDYDWFIELPFPFVGNTLTMQTDLDIGDPESALRIGTDSETFVDGPAFMQQVVGADILEDDDERGVLLTHTSGVQVYVGWDSTAHRGTEMFSFVPFDGEDGVPAPSAADALDLLRPNRAAAADQSCVERQGEWFLVPTVEDAEGSVQKPGVGEKSWRYSSSHLDREFDTRHEAIGEATLREGVGSIESVRSERKYASGSPLESHVPRDWRASVDDETFIGRFRGAFPELFTDGEEVSSPQDCLDLLWEREGDLAIPEDEMYERVRSDVAEGIQVRGTVRHRENDHEMAAVDEWRAATTHDWEALTLDDANLSWTAVRD